MIKQQTPLQWQSDAVFQQWRETKLKGYPAHVEELFCSIEDPFSLTAQEEKLILQCIAKTNMVLYRFSSACSDSRKATRALLEQLMPSVRPDFNPGADEDGITALTPSLEKSEKSRFVPYQTAALHWHTDGYYNTLERSIRGLILHCVQPAIEGGENSLLDHELVYMQLRDENPAYIEALSQPDVLVIPAFIKGGKTLRPRISGPVFQVLDDQLHMRYTARKKNILWSQDASVQSALVALQKILKQDSPYLFKARLAEGEGLLCNNVLHTRTAFSKPSSSHHARLLYRMRCYDCFNRV
ncbi:TauD/TfdA family dioxygenase [Magnetococcales bacterium HHB-1]